MFRKKYLIALFLTLLIGSCQNSSACNNIVQRDSDQPNIILIMTDDQPQFTIDFMPIVQERLVQDGVLFPNAFTTTPLCCPSRASILTGQYAHTHGVLTNRLPNGGATIFDDSSTLAVWLQDAGYKTSYIGKYLNGYSDMQPQGYIPPGWENWQVFLDGPPPKRFYRDYTMAENGELVQYGDSEKDFSNNVLTEMALDFIHSSKDEPFFLVVGYYAPHQPFDFAAEFSDTFRTDEQFSARRPPNFNEEDVSDKPIWLQNVELTDGNRVDQISQRSLRSLMSVDQGIKEMLAALECIGQLENTAVIYISDNGVTAGEHRLANAKNCPYEECIKMPFVMHYPKVTSAAFVNDSFVLNIDIAPTIAEIAGVPIPDSVEGESLLSLLVGDKEDWRDQVLIEHWSGEEGLSAQIPTYQAVRTSQWKYVRYENGEAELYDLIADPFELENLALNPDLQLTIEALGERIDLLLNP